MPRGYINAKQYRKTDLIKYLVGEMDAKHISQAQMGRVIGLSQQGFSYKKKTAEFTFTELLLIFNYLKTPDEQIIKLMKLERGI